MNRAADGFFTLNARPTDLGLLPRRSRAVVRASELLRRVRPLRVVADSVWVESRRTA